MANLRLSSLLESFSEWDDQQQVMEQEFSKAESDAQKKYAKRKDCIFVKV